MLYWVYILHISLRYILHNTVKGVQNSQIWKYKYKNTTHEHD